MINAAVNTIAIQRILQKQNVNKRVSQETHEVPLIALIMYIFEAALYLQSKLQTLHGTTKTDRFDMFATSRLIAERYSASNMKGLVVPNTSMCLPK